MRARRDGSGADRGPAGMPVGVPAAAPARLAAGVLAAVVAAGAAVPLYRGGPPPAHTGGFGEPLCGECHFGAPLNSDPGSLSMDAPAEYRAGATYPLEVRLARPGMAAAGFQLAIRLAEGPRAGSQAGALEPGPGVAVTADSATGVLYAHQSVDGAAVGGSGSTVWTVRWTAPDGDVPVVVHVAANAANDDASEFGDYIYAAEQRVRAAAPASVGPTSAQPAPVSRGVPGSTGRTRSGRVDDPCGVNHFCVFDSGSPLPRLER